MRQCIVGVTFRSRRQYTTKPKCPNKQNDPLVGVTFRSRRQFAQNQQFAPINNASKQQEMRFSIHI